MSAKTPVVSAGFLFDPATPATSLRLDTPAWQRWLEDPTTRRFAYPLYEPRVGSIIGFMTVRKEGRQLLRLPVDRCAESWPSLCLRGGRGGGGNAPIA